MRGIPSDDRPPQSNEQVSPAERAVPNEQALSAEELLPLVHSQLNTFGVGDIIFEQFKLLDPPHRIQGSAPQHAP